MAWIFCSICCSDALHKLLDRFVTTPKYTVNSGRGQLGPVYNPLDGVPERARWDLWGRRILARVLNLRYYRHQMSLRNKRAKLQGKRI